MNHIRTRDHPHEDPARPENDPPYRTERCFNALRVAHTLMKREPEAEITYSAA